MKKRSVILVALAGLVSMVLAWQPLGSIDCDLQCDMLAAKYGWPPAMVAQCHENCDLGNGACPLPPEECEPDEPD